METIERIKARLADMDAEIRATNLSLAAAMQAEDKPEIRRLRGYRYNLEDQQDDLAGALRTARGLGGAS
jgi:hypothetical protein